MFDYLYFLGDKLRHLFQEMSNKTSSFLCVIVAFFAGFLVISVLEVDAPDSLMNGGFLVFELFLALFVTPFLAAKFYIYLYKKNFVLVKKKQ